MKKIVGYVRSLRKSQDDCDIQAMLIKQYLTGKGLKCGSIYMDKGSNKKRNRKDLERAEKLGIIHPETTKCFPAWEEMLLAAARDEIGVIVVDRKERLFSNLEDKRLLDAMIWDHDIVICEIDCWDWPAEGKVRSAAIYHYFVPNCRKDGIRTANLVTDIGRFYEKITSHDSWKLSGLYIDEAVFKRTEFPRLMARDDIDVVICKYFYHINRKTLAFLQLVQNMNNKGITLLSTEEGVVHYDPTAEDWLKKNLRAATYDYCRSVYEISTQSIRKKRLELFINNVADQWCETANYEDETQTPDAAFEKMTERIKEYDIIVIESFTKLGETVNELMEYLRKIRVPVYSLQEGLLYIDGNEEIQSHIIQPSINSS